MYSKDTFNKFCLKSILFREINRMSCKLPRPFSQLDENANGTNMRSGAVQYIINYIERIENAKKKNHTANHDLVKISFRDL